MATVIKGLYAKFQAVSVQAKAGFFYVLCGVFQSGLAIITLPLFTRILSLEEYGVASTFTAWLELVMVLATLRLTSGVFYKGMLVFEEEQDAFSSAMLGLATCAGLICWLIYLLFQDFFVQLFGMSSTLCSLLFAVSAFSSALSIWTARKKFEYQYQKFTAVTLISSLVTTSLSLILVFLATEDKANAKVYGYALGTISVNLLAAWWLFSKSKVCFNLKYWVYALKYSIPLLPHFLSTLILDKADRIMINNICGSEKVALYNVPYNLARMMILLTAAVEATYTPWFYARLKRKDYAGNKKLVMMILLFLASVSVLFMLFAPEVLMILASSEYAQAVYIVPPVAGSFVFVGVYSLVSKIEYYYEKTSYIAFFSAIGAVLNVVLNLLLIPRWGYIVAGYTTLFCYVLFALGHMLVSYRLCVINNLSKDVFPWKSLCILQLIMLTLILLVNLTYYQNWIRYTLIGSIAVILFIRREQIIKVFNEYKCLVDEN